MNKLSSSDIACLTGSNGFIGRHIAKYLIDQNVKVIGVPREFLENPHEIGGLLNEIVKVHGHIDYIFHTAAFGNHYDQKDQDETLSANLIKTFFLLREATRHKFKAFINFGSSSEYGRKTKPMHEDDVAMPDTFYGATKVGGTAMARAFAKQYNKNIITVRPFSIYGEGEGIHRFIPTVCHALASDSYFPLDADPVHDWLHVDDFISGLMKVVENADDLAGEIVNIGSGIQTSNNQVVKMLEKIAGKRAKIEVFGDSRTYDTQTWVASINKLKSLGWKPKLTLEEGLKKTYKAYTKL